MLRIITTDDSEAGIVVRICGQFTSEYVSELEAAISRAGAPDGETRLDLGGVTFVDRPAMVFLCSAAGRNIRIENIPSYVRRWMEQERHCGPTAELADCPDPCDD